MQMEIYKCLFLMIKKLICAYIAVSIFCSSCDSSLEPTVEQVSKKETLISKNWKFVHIEADGVRIIRALEGFDPIPLGSGGGIWIPWYWFSYNSDQSYEIRSEVARQPYGLHKNYQPVYGYWVLDEDKDILIHNKGMPYEKTYRIVMLNDTIFVRDYEHIIYQSQDPSNV